MRSLEGQERSYSRRPTSPVVGGLLPSASGFLMLSLTMRCTTRKQERGHGRTSFSFCSSGRVLQFCAFSLTSSSSSPSTPPIYCSIELPARELPRAGAGGIKSAESCDQDKVPRPCADEIERGVLQNSPTAAQNLAVGRQVIQFSPIVKKRRDT